MPSRRRIRTFNANISGAGGGAATIGNLEWGPAYGQTLGDDASTFDAAVSAQPLSQVAVAGTRTAGVQQRLTTLVTDYSSNPIDVGATLVSPYFVAEANVEPLQVSLQSPYANAVAGQRNVAATHTMPSLAAVGTAKELSAHLSGTVTAAPFWQSVATKALATTLGATTIVVNKPSGLAVDDLMLAWICGNGGDVSAPAGWTTVATGIGTGTGVNAGCFWKKADSSDVAASNFTFTYASNSLIGTGEIHRINGQHLTTPVNASASASTTVIDPVVPAVTTTATNCLVFALVGHSHALAQSHAPPASHVEQTEFSDTNVTQIASTTYTRVFAAAASTGTATVDCNELAASLSSYARVAIAPGTLTIAS